MKGILTFTEASRKRGRSWQAFSLALTSILLLIGLVCAEDVIVKQNVKLGDYIRQYAMVEVDNNGAVYKVACDDCLAYITLYDDEGLIFVRNASMVKLDNGLYGYDSSGLDFGRLYNARYEIVSVKYGGSAVINGEVQITDDSEWMGAVALDTPITSQTSSSSSSSECLLEDYKGDFMGMIDCTTGSAKADLEGVEVPFLKWKLGIVGTVIFSLYWLLTFVAALIAFTANGLYNILTLVLAFVQFIVLFLDPASRSQAISGGLSFVYSLLISILLPFMPVILVCELFIVYRVCAEKTSYGLIVGFFRMNYNMIREIFNGLSYVLNLLFGVIAGVLSRVGTVVK